MTSVTAIRPPHLELSLTVDRSEVSRARRAAARALKDLGYPELVENAQLIVSELVTNALHLTDNRLSHLSRDYVAQSRVRFQVHENDGHPAVEVWDAFPDEIPLVLSPGSIAEQGRGLHIVAHLAKEWGYVLRTDEIRRTWKCVWAVLR
ncbi:hypothetical protein GCM10010191_80740 [Actinomadura vinacea]|uniref:Histidine kinase/HSP90-like ATPase domain-containing protein n=1 Tax=Actinomadura vinacea TaxID=115336 RepID=A0ABP5XDD2_9ACTN